MSDAEEQAQREQLRKLIPGLPPSDAPGTTDGRASDPRDGDETHEEEASGRLRR